MFEFPILVDDQAIYPYTLSETELSTVISRPFLVYTCLSTYFPEHKYWSDDPLDEHHLEWLMYRVNLMRETTKKSLDQQFAVVRCWTILVRNYPVYIIDKIRSVLGDSDFQIRFICLPDASSISQLDYRANITVPFVKQDIYAYLRRYSIDSEVIVSRIDSDDEYHPLFNATLQIASHYIGSLSSLNLPHLLHVPFGQQTLYETKQRFSAMWPYPAFVNLLLRKEFFENISFDSFLTPFSFSHDNPPFALAKSVVSVPFPMWTMNIHGNNIQNSLFPWSIKQH